MTKFEQAEDNKKNEGREVGREQMETGNELLEQLGVAIDAGEVGIGGRWVN